MNAKLFALQSKLQADSYGYKVEELEGQDLIEYIRWNILALEDELHEALSETSWKPWANAHYVNRVQFLKELVDAAHFFNNLWLAVAKLDPVASSELLEAMYEAKHAMNAKRMAEGYDGKTSKCPHCKRALDDGNTKEATDEDGLRLAYCVCGFVLTRGA